MFQVGEKNPYKDDRIYYHVCIWSMRHLRIWELEPVKCSQELYERFIQPVMEDRRRDVPSKGYRQNGNNLMFRTGDFKSAYNLDWPHLLNRHFLSFCEYLVHIIKKKKEDIFFSWYNQAFNTNHLLRPIFTIQVQSVTAGKNQVCPTFFSNLIL